MHPAERSNMSSILGPTSIPIPANNTVGMGTLGSMNTGLSVPINTSFIVKVTGQTTVSNNPAVQQCVANQGIAPTSTIGAAGDAYHQLAVSASVVGSTGESGLGFWIRDGGNTLITDTLWAASALNLKVARSGIQGSINGQNCSTGLYLLNSGQTIQVEVLDGQELSVEPAAAIVRKGTAVSFTVKSRGAAVTVPSWQFVPASSTPANETSACGANGANPCVVTVKNTGELRAARYLYGRWRSASASLSVYTDFTLSADRSEVPLGATVNFTPKLDGVDGAASRWVWRPASGGTVGDPCISINNGICAYGPATSGTMWAYTNSNDSASASISVYPAKITLSASSTTVDAGESVTFTATGNFAPMAVQGWAFRPAGGVGGGATSGSSWETCVPTATQCTVTMQQPGTVYVSGTVAGIGTNDSVYVSVIVADTANDCGASAMRSPSVSGFIPLRSNLCNSEVGPQIGDDVGDEIPNFDCGTGSLDFSYFVPTSPTLLLADARPNGGPWNEEATSESECTVSGGCTRDATVLESLAILHAALGSGEWTYTQGGYQNGIEPPRNISLRYGDCTDYTWEATRAALGPGWPHEWAQKMSTSQYHDWSATILASHGYRRVPVDSVRPGDIVVRGDHAGVFQEIDSAGNVWGIANNGIPATPLRENKDYATGRFNFRTRKGVIPDFFRALVTIACP
jgi:hypothetical protein